MKGFNPKQYEIIFYPSEINSHLFSCLFVYYPLSNVILLVWSLYLITADVPSSEWHEGGQ